MSRDHRVSRRWEWADWLTSRLTRDVRPVVALEDADVVSFAGELQSCRQTTEACPDNENVDASAWVCADWCEFHCFISGDFAEDSTLCCIRMRVDSDKTI